MQRLLWFSPRHVTSHSHSLPRCAQGQVLIAPDYQLDGWTTSLPAGQFSGADIIALYADHGTHEQFHSEFKTDLDLTRLPSGKHRSPTTWCANSRRWR